MDYKKDTFVYVLTRGLPYFRAMSPLPYNTLTGPKYFKPHIRYDHINLCMIHMGCTVSPLSGSSTWATNSVPQTEHDFLLFFLSFFLSAEFAISAPRPRFRLAGLFRQCCWTVCCHCGRFATLNSGWEREAAIKGQSQRFYTLGYKLEIIHPRGEQSCNKS